ncbi:MAG: efflux RND transporter periplasmic adaptor subunit [Gemmatimonadaceae bacterium]|nr:efflux RND transporter periplasmic adaptor subunit [Gemmatimonadaceae bacterium]
MTQRAHRSTASTLLLVGAVLSSGLLSACAAKKEAAPVITNLVVERRTIVVNAQATGAVEPINVIEVKSKASGQITKIPVETGTQVRAGDLLVQVDTRDVQNQYDQASADLRSAKASIEIAEAAKKRADEMFKSRVITTPEYESAQLALTQAQGQIVRATTNLDLAKQRLEDATVVAPVSGTIIDKPVSLGQVIASATGSVSGGTTLLKMADLTKVRVRALVNETDIGNVRAGQTARVTVDAYPERPFMGVVEKIEPQAVVQQSVTMFPVIVSLDNSEGFLKPGMNGEVSMNVNRRENVIAVSNDAVRTVREAATSAAFVGLNPDSVQAQVREMQAAMGNGRGGAPDAGGMGQPAGDSPAAKTVDAAGQKPTGAPMGGGRPSGSGDSQGGQRPRRSRGDSSGGMSGTTGGSGTGDSGRGRRRGGSDSAGAMGGGTGRAGGSRNAMGGGAPAAMGAGMQGGRPGGVTRVRTALVFVQIGEGKYEPRLVRLGAADYDYSEVVSGLKEGEKVASLSVAALQAKRDQANDRFRTMTGGGGIPGTQTQAPRGGGGAPGGGGGGGGRPPGGN